MQPLNSRANHLDFAALHFSHGAHIQHRCVLGPGLHFQRAFLGSDETILISAAKREPREENQALVHEPLRKHFEHITMTWNVEMLSPNKSRGIT